MALTFIVLYTYNHSLFSHSLVVVSYTVATALTKVRYKSAKASNHDKLIFLV